VEENLTAEALKILDDDSAAFHVPDLFYSEVGNILWKKVRRGEISVEQCRAISRLVSQAPLEPHASAPMLEAAVEIALKTGRSVYDSMYITLAVRLNCPFVTADEKLCNSLKQGPLRQHIRWIGEILTIQTE
jgi:predicted nucleic acid-binding protein